MDTHDATTKGVTLTVCVRDAVEQRGVRIAARVRLYEQRAATAQARSAEPRAAGAEPRTTAAERRAKDAAGAGTAGTAAPGAAGTAGAAGAPPVPSGDYPPPSPAGDAAATLVREAMTRESDGCIEFHDLPAGRRYYAVATLGPLEAASAPLYVGPDDCPTLVCRLDTGFELALLAAGEGCEPIECNDLETGRTVLARLVMSDALGEAQDVQFDVGFGRVHRAAAGAPEAFAIGAAAHAGVAGRGWRVIAQMPITPTQPGTHRIGARVQLPDGGGLAASTGVLVRENVRQISGDLSVTLRRTAAEATEDLPLWVVIRNSTNALSFRNYALFMDQLLCGQRPDAPIATPQARRLALDTERVHELAARRFLPYTDSDAYRVLKVATEAFVMVNCGVFLARFPFSEADEAYVLRKVGVTADLQAFWRQYLQKVNGSSNPMLPYLALVRQKLREVGVKRRLFEDPAQLPPGDFEECWGILASKLTAPCLLELIWSYWHEEGMLVQTMNAVTRRFQNVRIEAGGLDPLANFEVDPLRPLANLLWAYALDEQHRLSVVRRNYEYDHEYGLRLEGRAVSSPRPADSRSKFLEAFHHLLYRAAQFYRQDDNTTIVADGFPVLNALKEVHLILGEGAHNQFGDLPSTARIEMLMQQWLLSRPEFREFLPTRVMVAYPEPWMDRVDAMKRLQGWGDTNVLHFHNLGKFGEQLLLSIRYGAWSTVDDAAQGANWARFWRTEVQGYLHAYRAATGVELSAVSGDARVDATLPSTLLRRRVALPAQAQRP